MVVGACGLLAAGAQAQSSQPVAQVAAVPVATAPSAGQAVLRNGTLVPLRLMETLTTRGKLLRAGYRFRLETAEPVTVDGHVVIPAGSLALGEITEVRNKGMWGKSGKFAGRILHVNVNGRQVRMSGQLDDKGTAGGVGAVAVSALVFLPAGFFMTGTSASLPIGAPIQGFIDEDVALAYVPAPVPMPVSPPTAIAALAVPAPPQVAVPQQVVVAPPAPTVPAVAFRPAEPAPARSYGAVASQPVVTRQLVTVRPVSVQPVVAQPVAVQMVSVRAAPAPMAAQSISGMSVSAKRYAQRDEYIRLIGQMGLSPAAAMAAVESKYGMAME